MIAIVDDDPVTLKKLEILLQLAGYRTVASLDGHGAVELLSREQPDLLLLDFRLGHGLRGSEVLVHIHHDPRTAMIPVILMSADEPTLTANWSVLGRHARGLLAKPFVAEQLYAVVAACLDEGKTPPAPWS